MNHFRLFFRFIRHFFAARTKYRVHSPFVYNLLTRIIRTKVPKDVLHEVNKLRKDLLNDKRIIEISDYGAGSLSNQSNIRSVKEIAANALSTDKFLKLYYNLIKTYKPNTIIELGTSLGLSSTMMAMARPESKVYTLEGCPNISSIAQENFEKLQIKNIEIKNGEFGKSIPELLKIIKKADLVFFDGNHRKQPTIDYFNQFLPYKTNESIFIFDDIHWSKEMEEAWEQIKIHPEVKVSIDLFFLGIIFFRKELSREHFIYRF